MILGILDADILREGLIETYESYAQMTIKLFEQVLNDGHYKSESQDEDIEGNETLSPMINPDSTISFKSYTVRSGIFPNDIDECDAYLVTGSKSSAYETDQWILNLKDFIQSCFNGNKPLLGICFGHQVIAEALGGKTELAKVGWGVGVHSYSVNSEFQKRFPSLKNQFSLLVSHRDQVVQLPNDAHNLAKSDFCPNAAYVIKDKVLCFQGHPEFTPDYSDALMKIRKDDIGEVKFNRGQASLTEKTHHLGVAKALLDFILG